MTELSPAAQAALTAFNKYPLHGNHIANNLMHGALPAALPAAALYCRRDKLILHGIAEELEGVKYGTYRCELEAQLTRQQLLAIAAELRHHNANLSSSLTNCTTTINHEDQ